MIRTPRWLRDKDVHFGMDRNRDYYWLSTAPHDGAVVELRVKHYYPEERRELWWFEEHEEPKRCKTMEEWKGQCEEIRMHMEGGPPCDHNLEPDPTRTYEDGPPGACDACIEVAQDLAFESVHIIDPDIKREFEEFLGARWDAVCQLVDPMLTI